MCVTVFCALGTALSALSLGLHCVCYVNRRKVIKVETYFNNQHNAQFLYSITICMLHYNPRHVSSTNMPIFRRKNCIITASGIVTLCTVQYSTVCRMRANSESALIRHTVQPFTDSDDTRCCDNTICPPEDGHVDA